MKYLIRMNKSRGQPGRGTWDHVWRVFAGSQEYICKHIKIGVPCWDERTGEDYSIACEGVMKIDKETSTIEITQAVSVN
jgi:hypothetical protein